MALFISSPAIAADWPCYGSGELVCGEGWDSPSVDGACVHMNAQKPQTQAAQTQPTEADIAKPIKKNKPG